MLRFLQHVGWRVGRLLAITWVALVVLVAVFQRSLLYFPTPASEASLVTEAGNRGLEAWRDAEGKLIGWRRPRDTGAHAANRLLVFHGNAGFALNRWYYVEGFGTLEIGRTWDVHLFEYPGYGSRPGSPGEEEFTAAAAAAIETLRAEDQRPIFVLGESIGSGPACRLAETHTAQIAGAILVTPYARLVDVAAHHYPLLPVRLLMRDHWDNVTALGQYQGRVAVWLAGADEIIPVAQGRELFDQFPRTKRLWLQTGAGHNRLDFTPSNSWWRETSDFLLGKTQSE